MVSSNNAINNTIGASISGVTNTLTVTNPSNTASSAARETITVGGGSAGDPTLNWNVNGVTNWEMGIDNSDSDKWKLSNGTALGTTDTIVSFVGGQVLKPRQPAFLAYANATIANVTGDGTTYNVIFNTKMYDVGTNYNAGTGSFTVPVSGVYLFNTSITLLGLGAANNAFIFSFGGSGSTGVSRFAEGNAANMRSASNTMCQNGSVQLSLTAGDTVLVAIHVDGGAKTVSLFGTAVTPPAITYFSGVLLC